ncbi:MAG: insulinase family protein [Pseudomonadota bacterium]
MQTRLIILVSLLGVLLTHPLLANETGPAIEQVSRPPFAHTVSDLPSDPRLIYGELENGLRYAVMHNATPSGTASMRLRIAAGSLDETPETAGIAHYLEHMAFNGSENIPEGEMIARLERFGLSFGADTNAHTSFDETVYKLNLPTVGEAILDESFFIMRETADKLLLKQDAIDRERGIIVSEKRSRNTNSFQRLVEQMRFYTAGSGLVDKLPIGTDESIASINEDQMRAFYEAHYRPDKAFFVFVGDVEPEQIIDRIEETFGDWSNPETEAVFSNFKIPEMAGQRVGYHMDEEAQTEVTLAVVHPGAEVIDNSDRRRDRLINQLASGIMNSRLLELSQKPESGVLRGISLIGRYMNKAEFASIRVGAQRGDWALALEVAEQELRRALTFGFSEAELTLEIEQRRAAYEDNAKRAGTLPTHGRFGGLVDAVVGAYDNNRVRVHSEDSLAWFNSIISDIDIEVVEQAFRQAWADVDNLSVFIGTSAMIDEPRQAALSVLDVSRSQEVLAPPPPKEIKFAFEPDREPSTVVETRHDEELDTYHWRLSNNVLVNFKQTDFRDNEVLVQSRIGDGALSIPVKDEGFRRLALNLLSRGGVGELTELELQRHMSTKNFSWRLFFAPDADAFMLSGRAPTDALHDLLSVLASRINDAGLRRDAGENYKKKIRAWYDTHDATPGSVSSRWVPRLVRSGDARFGFDDIDSFLDADHDRAAEWLRQALSEGPIEITIVGDVESDAMLAQVIDTFGALDERSMAKGDYPEMQSLVFPDNILEPVTYWHAGEHDQARLELFWPAPDGLDSVRATQTRIISSILRNRLITNVREAAATSYSPAVGWHGDENSQDYGYVRTVVEVDPRDLDLTLSIIESTATDLGDGNISADELARAIEPLVGDVAAAKQTNRYWLNVLADAQSTSRGIDMHSVVEMVARETSPQDLAPLAEEIFASQAPVVVQILHESLRDSPAGAEAVAPSLDGS